MDSKRLNIFYQNVRGLRTKCLDLYNNILLHDFDIILITESWLQSDILDGEICDSRYEVFRCDRNLEVTGKRAGGGVVCCVRRELSAVSLSDWQSNSLYECICFKISARALGTSVDLIVVLSYMPPDAFNLPNCLDNYLINFNTIHDKYKNVNYLLVGDFNLPCLSWSGDGWSLTHMGSSLIQDRACAFVENLSLLGLTQHNYTLNHCDNTLDLCFSNLPLEVSATDGLTRIDTFHPPLNIDILDLHIKSFITNKICRYNFRKCDYELLNKYLSDINWDQLLSGIDGIDNAIDLFYEKLNECISLFVPLISHVNKSYPIWYTRSLIKIIHEKNKLHKKWKLFKNPRDYDEFKLLRDRQQRVQGQCFDKFTRNAEHNIRKAPKYFWNYIKSKRGSSAYPRQFTLGSTKYNNGQEICSAFNNFFDSVFNSNQSSSQSDHLSHPNNYYACNTISRITVSKETVFRHLSNLDKNKGAGCDGIPPVFWSSCAKSLSLPIALLFQQSLDYCTFPSLWKRAYVIPVHKKGSKSKIENYRPISILNCVAKVFEKIIVENIYPVISLGIPDSQHGFMQRRSTVSNLACFTDYVLGEMENGGQVDVVYTDFEKAFDRVDHVILLRKLYALGIHGDLLRWIKSYLSNRSQAVVLGGFKSDFISIPSGVPQGSHLGPSFYNAFIFDIIDHIKHSHHILYADDKKIYTTINSLSDCILLQDDLNSLFNYYTKNSITVSINKCQSISFTRKRNPITYQYNFNGVAIERVRVVRDLGILLDSEMSMRQHIDATCSRSFRNLGFVLRSCQPFKSLLSFKIVYFAYVRSLLEYGSQIWSPCYTIHKNNLERVQKKFLDYLNFKFHHCSQDYQQNCRTYNLLTLQERRILLDMGLLFDILRGRADCPILLSSIKFNVPKKRTRHTTLFCTPFHSTNYGKNGVISRLLDTYNKHFNTVDLFIGSKNNFKNRIIHTLLSS